MNDEQKYLVRTARITGVWYLLMAIGGFLGFMIFHPQLYIPNDPEKTLENLTDHVTLARVRLILEFIIVISQALTAVWFYKLFRSIDEWGAWTLGSWGMMNSIIIMISAISMGSVLGVVNFANHAYNDKVVLVHLLEQIITNAWGVGSLFFGLWLIPMGYIVLKSKRMPTWLGIILIIGGFGYLLNTFIKYMGFTEPWIDALVIPATIGEFWMIGYLLIYGIRESE
jgi:hypothetical protein